MLLSTSTLMEPGAMGETYTPEVDAHRAGSEQDERRSDSWPGSEPSVSVVIPTHQRAGYLEELLEVLTEQTIGVPRFEVIVCDDGSTDDTWAVLEKATDHSPLRLCALRQAVSSGPSRARNLACSRARAPLIAFTDDDCLPTPGWLAAVLEAFADADVVQGAVRGDPRAERVAGPWDKTLWVTGPTPWFETANISYRRELFERLGGFVEDDGVSRRPGGMAFGEDCLLGARALDAGAAACSPRPRSSTTGTSRARSPTTSRADVGSSGSPRWRDRAPPSERTCKRACS